MYRMFTFWSCRTCIGTFHRYTDRSLMVGSFLIIKNACLTAKEIISKNKTQKYYKNCNNSIVKKEHYCHSNSYPKKDKTYHFAHNYHHIIVLALKEAISYTISYDIRLENRIRGIFYEGKK